MRLSTKQRRVVDGGREHLGGPSGVVDWEDRVGSWLPGGAELDKLES